jgi:iron complex transport system substrate-binding protein
MRNALRLCALLLGLALGAVPRPQLALAAPDSYTDGTQQAVPCGLNAQRIVSLAPNVTEMLFFLGLGSRVVGRSDFCDYPPEAAKLPSVGGFTDTSVEQVVALKPDLVVAYQGNSLELVGELRQAGLTVLAFKEAATLDEVARQMEALWHVAAAPGKAVPGELSLWEMRLGKETIKSYPNAKAYFKFFFGYPGDTAYSAAPGSFIDDLLRRAGAANVVTDPKDRWPRVGAEFIVAAQPDWILTATSCTAKEDAKAKQDELLKSLQADPVWSKLPAVQKGQVVVLDSDVLLRPGPRLLDALTQLNAVLTKSVIDSLVRKAS